MTRSTAGTVCIFLEQDRDMRRYLQDPALKPIVIRHVLKRIRTMRKSFRSHVLMVLRRKAQEKPEDESWEPWGNRMKNDIANIVGVIHRGYTGFPVDQDASEQLIGVITSQARERIAGIVQTAGACCEDIADDEDDDRNDDANDDGA